MQRNPQLVFERLFGDGGSPEERAARKREDRSILDSVLGDVNRLKRGLGPSDLARFSDYLDDVREIERRVQMAAKQDKGELVIPDAPVGTPNDITEHFKLVFDLMALAFQADITRVITMSMDREASMRTYTNLSISEAFHPLSHHGNNPNKIVQLTKIQRYNMEVFAGFLDKLSKTPDGDGSILDHAVFMYGGNMSNSNLHNHFPLPTALIGGGCGKLKGGQHLRYPDETPLANLLVTLLDRVGVPTEGVGNSNGALSEI